ncbi:GGDEF domain-containing protein [Idiomarina xiamenensis]|uniref:diguanylate cyclase n=1 Tax=Idiomarina xiamenensis 10-D-4 TaxID=740709 RepID=K2K6Z0_9GAMM|nr:GGDEF domain-containing protein [Idiomarina xiamenensis]EKE83443.1 diguanylate cyclase [Idiomarina xiamenensis 10-D-4]
MVADKLIRIQTDSADHVIAQFKQRVAYNIYIGAVLLVLPLLAAQWLSSHWLMVVLLGLIGAFLLAIVVRGRERQLQLSTQIIFVILLAGSITYSIAINGMDGLFWAYPVLASIVFLLPARPAVIFGVGFAVLASLACYFSLPWPFAWRGILSLLALLAIVITLTVMLERMQQRMAQLIETDPLTGCFNRHRVITVLDHAIDAQQRQQQQAAMIMLDLDWFKPVNDKHGHLNGDRVLKQVARCLQQGLDDHATLFRVGGEEFMVVVPHLSPSQAEQLAQTLLQQIRQQPYKLDSGEIRMTASAGVASVVASDTWQHWLGRADRSLYQAKQAGRDRVVVAQQPTAEA